MMSESKITQKPPANPWLRALPGILISLAAITVLYFLVDLDELRNAFELADYRWLPVVLVLFLGSLVTRSMAWRTIMEEKVTFGNAFLVLNQGYLLNNVLPFRLGELGRALILGRISGLGFWRVLPTIVVERVFDLAIAVGMLLGSLPFVVGADWARSVVPLAGAIVLLGFGALFALAVQPKWVLGILQAITRPWPKLEAWVVEKVQSFLLGLSSLKHPARFLRVLFWMLFTWAFNFSWYYLLLRSFVPEAAPVWMLFAIAATSLGVAVPSSPAYIGVLEGVMVAALALFGVEEALSLAFALVAHVTYFVVTGIIGIYAFGKQGQSLAGVYKQLLTRSAADAE
jgi:hypothetical protein